VYKFNFFFIFPSDYKMLSVKFNPFLHNFPLITVHACSCLSKFASSHLKFQRLTPLCPSIVKIKSLLINCAIVSMEMYRAVNFHLSFPSSHFQEDSFPVELPPSEACNYKIWDKSLVHRIFVVDPNPTLTTSNNNNTPT
jgi:hypothetical protein